MRKFKELFEKIFRRTEEPEPPVGYIRQRKIYGFEIATSHSGQVCWIPGGKTHEGYMVPGFWKELDGLFVIEKDGKSHQMTHEEFDRYQAFLNE